MNRWLPWLLIALGLAGAVATTMIPVDCYRGITIGRVMKMSGC